MGPRDRRPYLGAVLVLGLIHCLFYDPDDIKDFRMKPLVELYCL